MFQLIADRLKLNHEARHPDATPRRAIGLAEVIDSEGRAAIIWSFSDDTSPSDAIGLVRSAQISMEEMVRMATPMPDIGGDK